MSVFTTVSFEALDAALKAFELGKLRGLDGISSGIENSNYYVDTTQGRFVLTLFETVAAEDLPYFLSLTGFFAEAGLPCARPIPARDGSRLFRLANKPAALVECLPGHSVSAPTAAQCAAVGEMLARLHRLGADFPLHRPNPRGLDWQRRSVERLRRHWPATDAELAATELGYLGARDFSALPTGRTHCDLFRDNVLFEAETLSGLLDFYYACDDRLLYDLAIVVNDWCRDATQQVDPWLYSSLLGAYARVRPFVAAEYAAWPAILRMAAMRFWLSRALDWHQPRDGELTYRKDPDEFRDRLLACHAQPLELVTQDSR